MSEKHNIVLVPPREYSLHSINTIKSLIGLDSEVLHQVQDDIIREDGLLKVNVTYSSLDLNPAVIYFIKKEDLKPISPESRDFGTKINGLNVLVDMTGVETKKYQGYYPITVMRKDFVEDRKHFQYYGIISTKPLGSLCTPLTSKNTWKFKMPEKLYPSNFNPKPDVTEGKMIAAYKNALQKFNLVSGITNIVSVKKFEECKTELNAYLINWEEIKKQEFLQGIILIQPARIYNIVLYIPSPMFMISKTDIENIDNFIEFSKINWMNYRYIIKE